MLILVRRKCDAVVFQAEDGIRDLVRSRRLGDVYKRQGKNGQPDGAGREVVGLGEDLIDKGGHRVGQQQLLDPVSYTHLTLPTSDLV